MAETLMITSGFKSALRGDVDQYEGVFMDLYA